MKNNVADITTITSRISIARNKIDKLYRYFSLLIELIETIIAI